MARKEKKPYQIGDYRGWMPFAWSTRAISLAINVVFLMQINYYCTNALGLDAVVTGFVLLASKIFDGVTDLFAGVLIDKTKSKFGKARPYEFAIIGVWVCSVLLFSTPRFGTTGKYIWLFCMFSLVNSVFATLLNTADAVYLGRALKNDIDRTKLMSINGVLVMVMSAIISIALPTMIVKFAGETGSNAGGWTTISLIIGIPLGLLGMGRFLFIKERPMETTVSESSPRVTVKDIVTTLGGNKYIFILGIATLLANIITNIISGVQNYYFTYVYGDLSAASTIGMINLITPFLLLVFPLLMRKYSLTQLNMVGIVFGFVGNLIKLLGPTNMVVLMVGNVIAGIGLMPLNLLGSIFVIECMDFGEWKNGSRIEGAYSSVNGFAAKVGSGVASALVGIIIGAAGFNAALTAQPDSALFAMRALYAIIPAVIFVVMFFVFMGYNTLAKQLPTIRAELEAKRSGAKKAAE